MNLFTKYQNYNIQLRLWVLNNHLVRNISITQVVLNLMHRDACLLYLALTLGHENSETCQGPISQNSHVMKWKFMMNVFTISVSDSTCKTNQEISKYKYI